MPTTPDVAGFLAASGPHAGRLVRSRSRCPGHRGAGSRRLRRTPAVVSLAAVALLASLASPAPSVAQDRQDTAAPIDQVADVAALRYEAPVPVEVVRAFEPPITALGPGHRGVDLAAQPGTTIRAAAHGEVSFAGAVAGTRWVSIRHPDGVVTSYGPLTDLRVRRGERVGRGTVVGSLAAGGHGHLGADEGLHWGARRDGRYIDPLTLLDAGIPRPSLSGEGAWRGTEHVVRPYEPWPGGRIGGWTVAPSPVADRQGFPTPPNPNHLVLVPGLGTSSGSQVLDAQHLGIDPSSVTAFSYAGRHDGDGDTDDPRRDQLPYGPADTWPGIEEAARRLERQLREQATREPGRPVDLVGHSMGGVTILHYLLEHHDPYDRSLPPIGHVVTIASPLHGSDAASVGTHVRDHPVLGPLSRHLQHGWGLGGDQVPLDAPAIDQLVVGSPQLWDLAVAWERAVEDGAAGPFGTGTRVLTIGGARDVVVSSDRTRQPDTFWHDGAPPDLGLGDPSELPPGWTAPNGTTVDLDGQRVVDHRVLPGGHGSVLATEAVREVVWRFLAGEEVVDSPGHLSTIVGGELQDGVRVASELWSAFGRIGSPRRDG